MHMCYSRGGVGTFAKEKVLELMLINLWEKEVTGGRSGHVGRTVRQFDSFSSREVVSLAWAERLDCGRSDQGVRTVRRSLNKLTRDVLGL